MVRTVISLEEGDKQWLDRKAMEAGVTMTEIVRRAVRRLRKEDERAKQPGFGELVGAVRGTWKHGDGLAWQQALRGEWDEPRP